MDSVAWKYVEELQPTLELAQKLGLIGSGGVEPHIRHSLGYAHVIHHATGWVVPRRVLDLGSGGGLPGLVLAVYWRQSRHTWLDASRKSATFLHQAIDRHHLNGHVSVICERAETIGRRSDQRGTYDVVVARAFAGPAVTAECAAAFLEVGGVLVVSEPPGTQASDRWSVDALSELGLEPRARLRTEFAYQVFIQRRSCPSRYPRRVGIPGKRPLF